MKRCPKCEQTYNDGSLNFCLLDGTPLADIRSEPTITIPSVQTVAVTPNKTTRRRWIVPVVVGVLAFAAGSAIVAGFLFYRFGLQDETAWNRQREPANASTPRPATPKPTSSQPAPTSVPSKGPDMPSPAPDEDVGEVTPISWSTSTVQFTGETGKTYRFQCPEGGPAGTIWGSDIYTGDSSICTAAVHAGVITLEEGGQVTIEFRPGRSTYGSTVRNGITSNVYGQFGRSFVVR